MNPFAVFIILAAAAAPAPRSILPPMPDQTPPRIEPAPPPAPGARRLAIGDTIPDWQARWELARALSYLRRYDESLAEYRKVLAERGGDDAVRQDFGQVLLWAGRTDEAFAELSRIPPAALTPAAALALADTLVARSRFEDAEALYRQHLARDPADQVTRFKLAEILSWTRRFDASLALYREIIAALPGDVQVRRRYALVLLWAGRTEEAAAEMRRTLPE